MMDGVFVDVEATDNSGKVLKTFQPLRRCSNKLHLVSISLFSLLVLWNVSHNFT